MFLPAFLLATGCSAEPDYAINEVVERGTASLVLADGPAFELTADARFETSGWGEQLGTCELRLAFMLSQHDEDQQEGIEGQAIALATEAGSCAVTYFDADTVQEAMEYDPPGFVDAGEVVYLSDEQGEIALSRRESGEGTVEYALADCSAETFPFGRTLDIGLPDGLGEVAGFSVSDALSLPPALAVIEPVVPAVVDSSEGLVVAWAEESAAGTPSRGVTLRNQDLADNNRVFEAVHCLPPSGDTRVEISADVLAGLTPSEEEQYSLVAQVDLRADATDVTMPWGQVARLSGNSSVSGDVTLVGDDAEGE